MKKLGILGLVFVLGISIVGCGNDEAANTTDTNNVVSYELTEELTEDITTITSNKKDNKSKKQKVDVAENTTEGEKPNRTTEQGTSQAPNTPNGQRDTMQQPTTEYQSTQHPTTEHPTTQFPSTQQPTTEAPTPNVCKHNWKEYTTTIHHEAEYECVTTQDAIVYHYFCYDCNRYYYYASDDPNGCSNGTDCQEIVQPATTEYRMVHPAWDETVGTGRFYCTKCGAEK